MAELFCAFALLRFCACALVRFSFVALCAFSFVTLSALLAEAFCLRSRFQGFLTRSGVQWSIFQQYLCVGMKNKALRAHNLLSEEAKLCAEYMISWLILDRGYRAIYNRRGYTACTALIAISVQHSQGFLKKKNSRYMYRNKEEKSIQIPWMVMWDSPLYSILH